MHKLRFRQIHLDFHTSPAIPGIGKAFDKDTWQKTLKDAAVDSITCFGTCHHGWSYYETEVGNMHPHLDFDLLRAQFDACKEVDVNVPIYLTAGVNDMVANEHPEWREISPNGCYAGWTQSPLKPGFRTMCFNTPYLDYLCSVIREVVAKFPSCDGIFLDIISQGQCCCRWCMRDMLAEGFDPDSEEDRIHFSNRTLRKYYEATTAAAKHLDEDMPVFHNSGHIQRGNRDILKYFSHLELESLPTGGWGYDHFPMSAKYCRNLEHDFLGMTGKFHTTWGEFGGIKHPNALRYECAAMLAYGSKCSVGDQLHPSGKIDETTYRVIGEAYREVAEKEAWCEGTKDVVDVAVLSADASTGAHARDDHADTGACRILLEGHIPFTLIDQDVPFEQFKMLILPDEITVGDELKAKLDAYLAQGGKLFLTGTSGLSADGKQALFDIGGQVSGLSEFNPDYVLPVQQLRADFVSSPFVVYTRGMRLKATDGESLGEVYDPYFNRTYEHYCSHQHTPYKPSPNGFDCGVKKGNILYLAHPVFAWYRGWGAVAAKDYILGAIRRLLGEDLSLTTNMPSTARVNLNEQPAENRYVLHLLYANTIARGGALAMHGGNLQSSGTIEVIEELMPLADVKISIKLPKPVKRVSLEPQGTDLPFETDGNRVTMTLDAFTCHQMIALSY
jgi:hypothetical protein